MRTINFTVNLSIVTRTAPEPKAREMRVTIQSVIVKLEVLMRTTRFTIALWIVTRIAPAVALRWARELVARSPPTHLPSFTPTPSLPALPSPPHTSPSPTLPSHRLPPLPPHLPCPLPLPGLTRAGWLGGLGRGRGWYVVGPWAGCGPKHCETGGSHEKPKGAWGLKARSQRHETRGTKPDLLNRQEAKGTKRHEGKFVESERS